MPALRPVILSGGAGTRLWPVSTSLRPKQFAPLLPGDSLFNRSLARFAGEEGFLAPVVVTGERHVHLIEAAASETGVHPHLVIAEPVGRNTAPASLAAALAADSEEVLVILPSDHLIEDGPAFIEAVKGSTSLAAGGHLVTFGVEPTRADTGFGYIERGDPIDGGFAVARFIEKPDAATAERMVEEGFVWNSGMFVMGAATLIEEAGAHCPKILEGVNSSMQAAENGVIHLSDAFERVEAASIDTAIMEKTDRAVVVPIDVGWSDIGSYDTLWSVLHHDESGNATSGSVTLVDVHGSLVRATSRIVAVAGLEDVVVVETEEAVIVVPRARSQMVRDVVAGLEAGNRLAE